MQSRFTWINGAMVETSQATVPFLTAGFHYGVAIFEGIRAYQTPRGLGVFRLREHMRRFEDSCRIVGFRELPHTVDEMMEVVRATVRANGFGDCYIRPLVWLADGGWNLTLDTGKPHVAVTVWEESVYLGQRSPEQGLKACVSSFTRHHPNAMMTKAKVSGNYANSIMAKTEAQRNGFDEAILLDPQGYVAECTGANLFVVRNGRLITPPADAILEGITRDTVRALAGDLGIPVQESQLSRDHLYVVDEVFVCGTAAEIVGVSSVDGRPIGAGVTGPITRVLREAYQSVVRGAHPRSEAWIALV
ncbi:MAG: branched-chain amino acid transaminase [Acidobacteria bacterium]|nr:branched-chain amino acid transaminase [Acidobacteriota bacterium]